MECLEGTLRLANAFMMSGGKRFVGVGTCAEYAASLSPLTVTVPLRPTTLYGSCKAAAFLVLDSLLAASDTSFVWCRLFYLFGEGEHSRRLTPTVRRHLKDGIPIPLTDGTQVRDFLDVSEAGRMIATVSTAAHTGAVNVCSGTGVSVRAYVERLADDFGRHDLLQFGSRPANAFDPPVVIGIRDEAIFPR
jgi:dTDP-6-deoxy-L-talose 4-dehydrogenase (NAD+)